MVSTHTLWGVGLTLLATLLFNLSPILQKAAIKTMGDFSQQSAAISVRSMLRNKVWLLGTFLGLVGGIPYTLALYYVGITVVEPLNNAGFLVLIVAAVYYLHEKLHSKDYIAIIFLITLPIFLALSEVSPPQNDILLLSTQLQLLYWSIFIASLSVLFALIAKKYSMSWAIANGLLITLASVYAQSALSAVAFGGYILPEDFKVIFRDLFSSPSLLLALFFGVLSMIFNIFLILMSQIGLQKNDASKFGPITQTVDNIFTVIIGIVVLGQQVGNYWFYILGFSVGMIGAILLSGYKIR